VRCFDTNVKGVFFCCKSVVPHMIQQRHGKIITISSTAGKTGMAGRTLYSATKFAVIGMTQALALELAPYGINVNAVCPGIVYTDLWKEIWNRVRTPDLEDRAGQSLSPKEYFDTRATRVPLGRPQTPQDIGRMVAFLCSEEARNITGQSINVCGGSEFH
jgi:NAD(P)-dependent dehydrogenase (short-subunit alcohol dehydrogenase family)